MMNAAVRVEGLHKQFDDVVALKNLSLEIAPGRLTGLVGPDGAGKTTLMRTLAAILTPDSGSVFVAGADVVTAANRVHQLTGYMPQRFGLYEDLTVIENLRLYAQLRQLGSDDSAALFQQLLTFTGLEPFAARLAGALSGGMKQKLGLACALMARPRVLLLDEPSVGVDPVSRQDLWSMVQALVDDGMAVVWATSYLDEAERCDDVLLLDHGELIYTGEPQALTQSLAGRTFKLRGFQGNKRALLSQALDLDCVRDGVIQGAALRLVVADSADLSLLDALVVSAKAKLELTTARFEDAFIDLLGGGPGGHSEIASRMEAVPKFSGDAVRCENLSKQFGDFTATDRISFSVSQGEILGLLGPNGAGKSTTFKMLCGLLRPTSGSAHVVGLDLRHSPSQAKLQLGYMAQKFSLYGSLSVAQNLNFYAGVYGLGGQLRRQRVGEMIEDFELQPLLSDTADTIPMGFKQRLALACALMHRPRILFLDEPTSGVDPLTRREFWTHITGLVERGVTVMVTTHFMEEAEYCDRVALVNRSRLIALDTPDGLKAQVTHSGLPEPTMEQAFIRLIEQQSESPERLDKAAGGVP